MNQSLQLLLAQVQAVRSDAAALEREAIAALNAKGWQSDYLTVRWQHDLQPLLNADNAAPRALVALGAARLGATRLIDNLEFTA